MAKIGMKLATAAILASTVPAGAQAPENDVQAQISEVLTNEENSDNQNTLSAEEVQVRLQIEKQIKATIKDKKLKELVDFYGENRVKSRMYEMVDEICKNLDKYGRFDSDGNFSISKDDGSLLFENEWKSLYKSKFGEYLKFKSNDNRDLVFLIGAVIVGFVREGKLIKRNDKLKSENEKLKKELADVI